MTEERNLIPCILTAVATVAATVAALWYYGYLHIAKEEDALLLADYTFLKTIPGQDYKVSHEPAQQVAQFRLELVGDGLEHEGDKQQDPDPVGTAETGAVKQWERGEERSAERYERGESELPFPSCRIDDQLPLFLILGDEYQGVATLYEHQEDEKSAKQGNDGPPVVL